MGWCVLSLLWFYVKDKAKRITNKTQINDCTACKENLISDLGKFYDIAVASSRNFERIWLTVTAEAQRNPKVNAIIIRQRQESEQWITGFFMQIWQDIGLFKDYKDNDFKILAKGMIALFNGTTIDRLTSKDQNANKKAWIKMMHAIFSGSR